VILANGEDLAFNGPILFRPQPGDVLDLYSTGGGGYGDPHARPVELVLADVRAGLLSVQKAAADYGVVVDAATLTVDHAATARLRDGAAAAAGHGTTNGAAATTDHSTTSEAGAASGPAREASSVNGEAR
jgi:N-methylhydantoinase B/oxoprolinase/acetone carboxylase alpha subunit